jgi:hypothetical protein
MNIVQAGGTYRADFAVQGSTGAAANADSLPAAAAYRNGAVDATVTVTVANMTTGAYTLSFTVPVGYAAGDFVRALVTAVIGGVTVVGWSHVLTVAGFPATALPNAAAGANGGVPLVGSAPLTNLDAAVSSRSTYAGGDTGGTTTLLGRLTSTRAGLLDNLDAAVSSRSTYAGGDTAGTTTLLARLTSTRAGLLDNLDAAVSTRSVYAGADTPGTTTLLSRVTGAVLLASAYTAPPSAGAISTQVVADLAAAHGAGSWEDAGGGPVTLAAGGLDAVLVAGKPLPVALRIIGAAVAGPLTDSQTDEEAFLDFAGTLSHTVTVDASGNRTLITYA